MSIVSDGWTNVKHQPLINVVASNSRGSMFLYAEDFSGVEKTGKAIADFLLTSIDEVGPSNVLQVVTDNASNCKAAGKEIEKVHKHIFWSPCVVHTLNLIFKDFVASFPWISETYVRGKNNVKYFLNHNQAHAIFKKQSGSELLKVAKTRFASHYLLLKRLCQCREALATTVVLTAWKDWVNSEDERMKALGKEVANTISDELFWDEVENILTVTKPIYLMIKFADGEGPKMGEVYEKMDCMIGEVGDIMKNNKHKDDRDKMNEIMVSRWEKMNIPMHCLAFALYPYYYDANYLQIPAPGGEARRAPNYDKEVVQGVLDAFDKIGEDEEERKVLRHQLARFQAKEGIFGKLQAKNGAVSLSPIKWWNTYGAETPKLAEIAVKVLSQPISSSSAERLQTRTTSEMDIEPESSYLDDSVARLEDMRWKGEETNVAIPRAPKRQRYAD
ncbi:L-seryl-tRNA(Sec) selenium transferase [Bienertia sinuspersici]